MQRTKVREIRERCNIGGTKVSSIIGWGGRGGSEGGESGVLEREGSIERMDVGIAREDPVEGRSPERMIRTLISSATNPEGGGTQGIMAREEGGKVGRSEEGGEKERVGSKGSMRPRGGEEIPRSSDDERITAAKETPPGRKGEDPKGRGHRRRIRGISSEEGEVAGEEMGALEFRLKPFYAS